MAELILQGIPSTPSSVVSYNLKSVYHVSEHLFTICQVYTGRMTITHRFIGGITDSFDSPVRETDG